MLYSNNITIKLTNIVPSPFILSVVEESNLIKYILII